MGLMSASVCRASVRSLPVVLCSPFVSPCSGLALHMAGDGIRASATMHVGHIPSCSIVSCLCSIDQLIDGRTRSRSCAFDQGTARITAFPRARACLTPRCCCVCSVNVVRSTLPCSRVGDVSIHLSCTAPFAHTPQALCRTADLQRHIAEPTHRCRWVSLRFIALQSSSAECSRVRLCQSSTRVGAALAATSAPPTGRHRS